VSRTASSLSTVRACLGAPLRLTPTTVLGTAKRAEMLVYLAANTPRLRDDFIQRPALFFEVTDFVGLFVV
jgi:hypothetical protein